MNSSVTSVCWQTPRTNPGGCAPALTPVLSSIAIEKGTNANKSDSGSHGVLEADIAKACRLFRHVIPAAGFEPSWQLGQLLLQHMFLQGLSQSKGIWRSKPFVEEGHSCLIALLKNLASFPADRYAYQSEVSSLEIGFLWHVAIATAWRWRPSAINALPIVRHIMQVQQYIHTPTHASYKYKNDKTQCSLTETEHDSS